MLVIFVSINSIIADELKTQVCNAKLLQLLKPEYPKTNHQGYSIVSFNINKSGAVSDIKSYESMCAISRNNDESIKFKKCPFFKTTSIFCSIDFYPFCKTVRNISVYIRHRKSV